MTKEAVEKPKAPQKWRYVGFEDIKVGGREIRNGDELVGEHFAHDKRFEKVTEKK